MNTFPVLVAGLIASGGLFLGACTALGAAAAWLERRKGGARGR